MKKACLTLLTIFLLSFLNHTSGGQEITRPKLKWKFKTHGSVRGPAVISREIIYFGSSDGNLYALNSEDGRFLWKYQTGGALTGSPAVADSFIYISGRDNYVYSLHAKTGKLNWKFKMQPILTAPFGGWEYFSSAPVVYGSQVLAGSGDGHLYSLDAKNGSLLWKFNTNARIRATPLVENEVVYQPSNDGYVYVLDVHNGKLLWKFETRGAGYNSEEFGFDRKSIYTRPLIKNNLLVFGSRDGNIYAVDLKTRKEKWHFSYGTTWAMATTVSADLVYTGWSTNNIASATDLDTGREKWKFDAGSHVYTSPLVTDSSVYIGTGEGNVFRLDKETGEKVWRYPVGKSVFSSLVVNTNTIFFGSDNGYFYALEEGRKPRLAIYEPFLIKGNSKYLVVDQKITPYFKEKGFEQLDSAGLYQFMHERINDKEPAVIVFSLPIIPKNIMGSEPETGMVRQYLEAGGKIVWMGDIPNYYEEDAGGNFKRDASAGTSLLGVEFPKPDESGNYFSKTTQEGLNYGLPTWLTTTNVTVKPDGVIPLAYDEYGRVSLWIKKFNSRPGSGFISCRTWGWNVPVQEEDLKIIYQLAVYGLE